MKPQGSEALLLHSVTSGCCTVLHGTVVVLVFHHAYGSA